MLSPDILLRHLTPPQLLYKHTGNEKSKEPAGDWTTAVSIPSGRLTAVSQLENLLPDLGQRLKADGVVTPEQLDRAYAQQAVNQMQGTSISLSQVLVGLQIVDGELLEKKILSYVRDSHEKMAAENKKLSQEVASLAIDWKKVSAQQKEVQKLKENFLGAISHELRTPLTHILGYLDLLAAGHLGELSLEQSSAVEVMNHSGRNLYHLITDLLSYVNASSNGIQINPTPTSIPQLLRDVLDRHAEKIQERQINLVTNVPDYLPDILVDSEKIYWVLAQIVDNAIKFNKPAGKVTITITSQFNKYLAVQIRDSGPGIPAERLADVFKPFHQIDGSNTRQFGGIGLGMALVQRIMDAHRLRLQIITRSDEGTSITCYFPIAGCDWDVEKGEL